MTGEKVFQKLKTERGGREASFEWKVDTEAEFQIQKLAFKKSLAWRCTFNQHGESRGISNCVTSRPAWST